mmetsp:Transcript_7038/g.13583  ORF Transcript_7038/g.13583 Transcript_7038/m.13583 type:complete len:617 (+) Transcript_7038:128-1978(+)
MGVQPASAMSIDLLLCSAEPPSLSFSRMPAALQPAEPSLPEPLTEKVLSEASVQLTTSGRATLEACLMAFKANKISSTDLTAFCRSMGAYSEAMHVAFNFPAEREVPFVADVAGPAKREPPTPTDDTSSSQSKRQCVFGDSMAAEALMALMQSSGRSSSSSSTSSSPSSAASTTSTVMLPPIQSILPASPLVPKPAAHAKKEPSVPSSGASSSAGSFANAKQCKSRKTVQPRVAVPDSSKSKKQDTHATSDDDGAQSGRSTVSPDSASGRAASPPTPSEETSGVHNKYCHFCQHVKVRASGMLACGNTDCTRRFCEHCLSKSIGDDVDPETSEAWTTGTWSCPVCRKLCCCSVTECDKNHRHCKAYRYRVRRAEQASRRPSGRPDASSGVSTPREGDSCFEDDGPASGTCSTDAESSSTDFPALHRPRHVEGEASSSQVPRKMLNPSSLPPPIRPPSPGPSASSLDFNSNSLATTEQPNDSSSPVDASSDGPDSLTMAQHLKKNLLIGDGVGSEDGDGPQSFDSRKRMTRSDSHNDMVREDAPLSFSSASGSFSMPRPASYEKLSKACLEQEGEPQEPQREPRVDPQVEPQVEPRAAESQPMPQEPKEEEEEAEAK